MQIKNSSDAFTGLEAAIVLIAFVVVAAVFSYVILGAGFYTTQKSQETVYKGVEQATTNVQMIGQVYGETTAGGTEITTIKFSIGLAPGAPAIDLSGMNIVFSTPNSTQLTILNQSLDYTTTPATLSSTTFVAQKNGAGPNVRALSGTQQLQIAFNVAGIPASTVVNMEIRPGVGAALPFQKNSPATIQRINVLT